MASRSADWLFVTTAFVQVTVCSLGFPVSNKWQQVDQTECLHYSNCAVYRMHFGDFSLCKRARDSAA